MTLEFLDEFANSFRADDAALFGKEVHTVDLDHLEG